MAALCYESDSNSSAPIEFNFTTSLESSMGISVAVERCPLCCSSRRPFYCKACIIEGEFGHSRGDRHELYKHRLHTWESHKREREKLLERITSSIKQKQTVGQTCIDVDQCRQRIDLLRKAWLKSTNDLKSEEEALKELKISQTSRVKKCQKRREKLRKICQYMSHVQSSIEKHQGTLQPFIEELTKTRRFHVEKLLTNIFPLTDIQPRSEPDCLALSTVSALKDATHTAYIKGKWVYADHHGDLQYRIVESILPGSGDYSAYNLWISSSRENVTPSSEAKMNQKNPAYSISAALCYTTQLSTVLGHILNVTLPRKLCYSEFCGEDLGEKHFNSSVARLNENILYLAFSQGVNLDVLFPKHTLHNVLALINSPYLGRESWFEVNPELVESIEGEILPSDDSDSEGMVLSDLDETDLGGDWERVPHELTDMDIQGHARYLSSGSSELPNTLPTSSVMSQTTPIPAGLMSSAAASVASLWRAATWKLERR